MIRLLEECAFRALPALETQLYDGWVLRFANGFTRRANSVNPVDDSRLPLQEKVAYCENYCTERGIPTHFRLTPLVDHLEAVLKARGYTYDGIPTYVQTVDLSALETRRSAAAKILPLDAWFEHLTHLSKIAPQDAPTFKRMLSHIEQPACFLTLCENGEVIAAGLGVLDSGYIGLFDIVVHENQRGRGIGKRLVSSLLDWGKSNGAQASYLQVMANNHAAISLYQNLGYKTLYPYWYWSKT
jgi:N-acetylglutamate synthase